MLLASLILAGAVAFTPNDAAVAHRTAAALVDGYTPRNAGTERGKSAANFILQRTRSIIEDAKRAGENGAGADGFVASEKISKDMANGKGAAGAAGVAVRGRVDSRTDEFRALTPYGERTFVNVECEFVASTNAEWIVFVSHFDTKRGVACPGANDGASTTGILAALAGVFARNPPAKTNVLLLWTDGEECFEGYGEGDGLWGSSHAAEKLAKSGRKVKAVVCLDMLGDRSLSISVPRNSTPALKKIALAAAEKFGVKASAVRYSIFDDHQPFIERGIPAVTLIDFEYGSREGFNDYWHTRHDTIDKLSESSLLVAGGIALEIFHRLCNE